MTDTLTTLIGKVQNILGDASATYFSTAACTAAIRQALCEWNMRAPQFLAVTITGIASQYEYELSDEDADAVQIIDVLRQGAGANEIDKSLDFDDYIEDERVFFRLRSPVTTSDTLIVRYTKDHTINGLDSETESTLPARYDQALVCGGGFFAIFIRAVSRVETINLSQEQSDNYRELAPVLGSYFAARMMQAMKRRAPVGEPDARRWADAWDTTSQKQKP
jgi:hypothetical protein